MSQASDSVRVRHWPESLGSSTSGRAETLQTGSPAATTSNYLRTVPERADTRRFTSYTSQLTGPLMFVREAVSLFKAHAGAQSERVAEVIAQAREAERLVALHADLRLTGLEMLDVGAGQRLIQMTYFAAQGNTVTGIDRDRIARGFDVHGYLEMARSNGARRVVKTLGRKAIGVDLRTSAALRRMLHAAPAAGSMRILQMDATDLDFPSESFDFAYSFTVLQYVSDPRRALAEMARVVRPGGGIYVDFLPFTGTIGSFDIRALGGIAELPPWAHLRHVWAESVSDSAYLNQWRLEEWREAFESAMPGCVFVALQPHRAELEPLARQLQAAGELRGYGIDELVTSQVAVVWRKHPHG